jgi:hypothetical protein
MATEKREIPVVTRDQDQPAVNTGGLFTVPISRLTKGSFQIDLDSKAKGGIGNTWARVILQTTRIDLNTNCRLKSQDGTTEVSLQCSVLGSKLIPGELVAITGVPSSAISYQWSLSAEQMAGIKSKSDSDDVLSFSYRIVYTKNQKQKAKQVRKEKAKFEAEKVESAPSMVPIVSRGVTQYDLDKVNYIGNFFRCFFHNFYVC